MLAPKYFSLFVIRRKNDVLKNASLVHRVSFRCLFKIPPSKLYSPLNPDLTFILFWYQNPAKLLLPMMHPCKAGHELRNNSATVPKILIIKHAVSCMRNGIHLENTLL